MINTSGIELTVRWFHKNGLTDRIIIIIQIIRTLLREITWVHTIDILLQMERFL